MQIQVDSRAAAAALVDYLRRCDLTARRVGAHVVEVSPPIRTQPAHESTLELEGYLRVWRILHPEFKVRPFALTTG